jgi:hypothetical protein
MQKHWRIQRRRAVFYLMDWLVIISFLIAWMIARQPVPTGGALPYIKAPGHILVQLAEFPKLAQPGTSIDPQWTLYGDGTLIFKTDPNDTLWRAQLVPGDIQHILNVVISQDTSFDHTQQQYRSIPPEEDDDGLLLTLNTNGQQKEVVLVGGPTNQATSDIQTKRLFAMGQFLLAYHPIHAVFYASDPDSDHESDHDSDDGQ